MPFSLNGFNISILSKSDIKSTICSYPGHLLSYFDISSAEVKSAGFMSKDENLINMFVNGIDVYIATAKIYLKDRWDGLSDKEKKAWRKKFKTTFLGILYGLGANSLATRLNVTKQDAEEIIEGVYQAYPKLREYVAQQQAYPLQHEGRVNTFFGDCLVVDEWRFYKTATGGEKRNLEARIGRLGRNAVYSSDIIDDKWTKTVNGENPNPVLRLEITRGFNLV